MIWNLGPYAEMKLDGLFRHWTQFFPSYRKTASNFISAYGPPMLDLTREMAEEEKKKRKAEFIQKPLTDFFYEIKETQGPWAWQRGGGSRRRKFGSGRGGRSLVWTARNSFRKRRKWLFRQRPGGGCGTWRRRGNWRSEFLFWIQVVLNST